jgi:hypothetical protein
MPVELQWGDGDDAEQQQQHHHHVMKVESGEVSLQQQHGHQQQSTGGVVQLNSFIYASRPPAAALQQPPRLPTEPTFPPGLNSQQAGSLSHSDMDLLRRARGGPCICPNCTLFPKRRAGKHNCHIPGCGREYSKTSHLRAHLVSHCNILPFACSWVGCNKRFYRTDQVNTVNIWKPDRPVFKWSFFGHFFNPVLDGIGGHFVSKTGPIVRILYGWAKPRPFCIK